jgi:HEAT repeat protein
MAAEGADRDLVVASLAAGDARTRQLALRAAARRGWLADAEWRRALSDGDAAVRLEALNQFARLKIAGHDAELVAAISDGHELVAEAAAFACGEVGVTSAVPALIDMAISHDDPRCRESAVAALGAIGDDRGRAAIIAALEDKPPVRRRAVVALSNFEGEDVDDALARAGEDRDWQVRAAVDLLGREPGD